jgi:hypothetical protein
MQNFTHRRVAMGLAGAAILVASSNAAAFLGIDPPSGKYKFVVSGVSTGNIGYAPGSSCTSATACDAASASPAWFVQNVPYAGPVSGGDGTFMEDSWGVGNVAQIEDENSGAVLWAAGQGGKRMTFMYGQVVDHNIEVTAGGAFTIKSVKGVLEFWLYNATDSSDYGNDETDRLSANTYNGITNLDGSQKIVSLEFVPGAIAGDFDTTYSATFDPDALPTGGAAYADVVAGDGTDWEWFDTDGIVDKNGDDRDVLLSFTAAGLRDPNTQSFDITITGDAVGQAPVPGTLALLGLGLFGLYGGLRRRA